MTKTIVYPAIPFTREVDPVWEAEYLAALDAGLTVGLFDSTEGKFYNVTPDEENGFRYIIYRGWISDLEILTSLQFQGAKIRLLAHSLVNTEDTQKIEKLFRLEGEFIERLENSPYKFPYFIKGPKKSYGKHSFIFNQEDLTALNAYLEDQGDYPEMFLCRPLRLLAMERRFFMSKGKWLGQEFTEMPLLATYLTDKFKNEVFIAIDIAYDSELRMYKVVEYDTGLTCDLKEWQAEEFVTDVLVPLYRSF